MEATNGTDAIDLLCSQEKDIDVVLLDLTLPGASSREVFMRAKAMRPDLKVILTSAYGKETVDASFAGLQFADFIRKPFQLGELVQVLRDTLSA